MAAHAKLTLLASVLFLARSSQDCGVSNCFSRRHDLGECALERQRTNSDLVNITLSKDASYNSSDIISLVLALICNSQDPDWSISAPPSLCAVILSELDTPCDCNNCTQLVLYAVDQRSNTTISSSVIVDLLQLEIYQITLSVAQVISVTSYNKVNGFNILEEVPIASWVCLVLGVVVSSMTLTKPLWWNKFILKFVKRKR